MQHHQIATDFNRYPEISLKLGCNHCRLIAVATIVVFGLEPVVDRQESKGRMHILLVEADSSLRHALSSFLSGAGFVIDVAFNGNEGLEKALQTEYDAIILEQIEAKHEGESILKELRHSDKRTPLLILASQDSSQDTVKWLDSGADACLAKPVELSELEARLRALIRRAGIKASSLMEVGPVVIDTAAKVVTVNGNRIPLTNKEFQLLEFLAENCGSVVTRNRIYKRLFNEIDTSLSNLVDVYVSNIRRKIGLPLIKTLRSRGYMIAE